jgi:adenine-specific DNA-methyltransferase
MEHINDYSLQSQDWNAERLNKLKELFPDWFTNENQLNLDEVKKVINPKSISETERYEFRWFGKSNEKRKAFTPSNATLVYDENRSVNPESTENLIIEGENLEVLKLLSTAYREKIKCIYIDPPYNTGKDFVYSDNFTQDKKAYWEDAGIVENGVKIDTNTETDGRFHSNWLNMMYSRLLIARQLLREDGVIFISIDDNEVHHLREIFL